MKGKVKKTLLGVAALAFAFAGVGSLATYEAKASTPALFEMVEGASVRTSADTSGIRFSFRVNSDQQTALSEYKAVEYGMLITQEGEATIDEIYNAGAAVFAENGDWSFNKEDIATKKYVANITGNTLVDEKDEQGQPTGNKLFNAALTNISQANFTKTYVGVGYIKTTSEGATDSADDVITYHFAENNNNERTITYVAEKAIADGDENAVGNAVVANYVSGGYENLGLTGTGTEADPFVVEATDCQGLINATNDKLIYGANKFMTFADGVDNAKITTDFAMQRNYKFIQTHDYANDAYTLDYFNSPSSTSAAHDPLTALERDNVDWHESLSDGTTTKYGVISMQKAGDATNNRGGQYYLRSSVRNNVFMRHGGSSKRVDFMKTDLWDYVSIWLYIDGDENEKVTVQGNAGTNAMTAVPCNTWVEYRWDKQWFINRDYYRPNLYFGENETDFSNLNKEFLLVKGNKTDYTVYVDDFMYVKTDDAFTVDLNAEQTAITVTPSTSYADELQNATYVYSARAYDSTTTDYKTGKNVTLSSSAITLSTTVSSTSVDVYWISAKTEINGKIYVSHCIYKYDNDSKKWSKATT